jgi:transposase
LNAIIIFPDLPEVLIEQAHVADEITLMLRTTSPAASCPSCGTLSLRVQSRYTRRLHDLPARGCPVSLMLHVRRFFCTKSTCAQKIFTERLPELCHPHAQRTIQLQQALCQLGLAAGGQAGAAIGSEQGLSGSRDTILRLVRRHQLPDPPTSQIVGIDDWAWKRRQRYGTLICDLESRQPIDLLADRSVETVSAWFQAHPHVEIVSRDGSSEYASAITKGAPHARQVSDRWHLVKNLAVCVSVQLAYSLAQLRRAQQVTAANPPQEEQASHQLHSHPRTQAEQRAQQARQAERLARYEQIITLRQQGMKHTDIAAHVGMAERTMREWLSRGDIPYTGPRKQRSCLIDPYQPYLLARWQQGCRTGSQLERELRAQGYKGSPRALYRYLATLEPAVNSAAKRGSSPASKQPAIPPDPLFTLSVQQATWLFFRKADALKQEERERLRQLRQASPQIEAAYQLVEQFLGMVRERTGEQLAAWLAQVQASRLQAFDSLVTGVQQDQDAVVAGLTLPWSNGPVEGHVNRLKLLKRSMYGRANFDLLKRRVLHHRKKRQSMKSKRRQSPQEGRLKQPGRMVNGATFQHTTFSISKVA